MPYSTLDGVLKRGIDNSSVGVIFKICKALNISPDALAEGEIVPKPLDYSIVIGGNQIDIEVKETIEVDQILEETKERLLAYRDLTLEGKKVKREEISTIVNGIDITLEMVKKSQK
jgi:transcriptional regulator with XRE-family HTH domain